MDDETLKSQLDRVRRGDAEAFAAVYRALSAPLFTLIFRMVRDRPLAEDLLQELFLRLYREPPAMDRPRAYLFQAARNLAIDAIRSRRETAGLDALERFADSPADRCGLRLDIRRALEQLSAEDCQIVTLHINAGLKFREIAGILSLPLGTVLWRYRRALDRLRTLLSGGIL